jgi:hypothetical protein
MHAHVLWWTHVGLLLMRAARACALHTTTTHMTRTTSRQPPIMGYLGDGHGDFPAAGAHQAAGGYLPAGQAAAQQQGYRQQPMGARLKVTRCLQLKAPESKRALLDFGLGVGVDLDRQVRPVRVCVRFDCMWRCWVILWGVLGGVVVGCPPHDTVHTPTT